MLSTGLRPTSFDETNVTVLLIDMGINALSLVSLYSQNVNVVRSENTAATLVFGARTGLK